MMSRIKQGRASALAAADARRDSRQRGFTLVETLTVLGILSLVLSLSMGLYMSTMRTERQGRQRMERHRQTIRFFELLERDLKALAPVASLGQPLEYAKRVEKGGWFSKDKEFFDLVLRSYSRLERIEYASPDFEPWGRLQEVRLGLLAEKGVTFARQTRDPLAEKTMPHLRDFSQLKEVRFRFYDGELWSKVWNAKELPELLEATLTVGVNDDFPPEIYRRVFRIPASGFQRTQAALRSQENTSGQKSGEIQP